MNKTFSRRIIKSKRLLDITFSFFILTITLPLTLLALVALKLNQIIRGRYSDPLFYEETRISMDKPFSMYKFNIFKYEQVLEKRSQGIFIHTKDFERNGGILAVGWLLKQIYMDELPQFYNVLKGDLSIVGPRPVNTEVYEELMSRKRYAKRDVIAGITGNFQSHKYEANKNADNMDDEYAIFYKEKQWYQILYFDIKIMIRTIKVILNAKGI